MSSKLLALDLLKGNRYEEGMIEAFHSNLLLYRHNLRATFRVIYF